MRDRLKVALRVIGVTCAATLLVTECGLRIAGVEYPDFYREDPRRGWSHEPGVAGWYHGEGVSSYVSISSQGLRDREHTLEKPAHTVRIAVLGDSFAEALQVSAEQAFWAHLEKDLHDCPRFAAEKIEVVNFGVSSYGTANEYLTLQDAVWRFSPDVVVLAFLTGNDFADNSPELDKLRRRPYYRLEGGKLQLDLSRNQPTPLYKQMWHAARKRLRTVQVLQRVRDVRAVKGPTAGNDVGLDDAVYKPPASAAWQATWEVTRALILAIRDDVERHKARFFFVTLSNPIQVNPHADARESFMKRLGVSNLSYADDELAKFAKDNGIAALTLASPLLAYATEHGTCLHGFPNAVPCAGHWNPEGHAAAGRIIARALCDAAIP